MKVTECDAQIEQSLAKLPDRSAGAKLQPKVKKCHRKPNTLRFEAIEPVFRAMGVDLTAIEGIEAHTALVILGEIGVDVASSHREAFCELAGLMPQPSREQPQAEIAAGAEGEEPGGDRVASGGAVAATLALGAGGLFSAYEQRTGVQRGDHGDGAQAGAIRLRHAQPWRSIRQPEFGRMRGGHAGADRTYAPKESRALGYDLVPRQPLSPAVS